MQIRKAAYSDIENIMPIYDIARKFMVASGNPGQWDASYPSEEIIRQDIAADHYYVVTEEGRIVAAFAFIIGEDPTYKVIENGTWHSDALYGTVHRLASDGTTKGISRCVFDFCSDMCGYLRADTHHDNKPMQAGLKNYGFKECGIIYVRDHKARIAFDYERK